ncbi:transmembrane protein, putative (macronuclear) [Tetrahymena thermophila SB210]|uniref:Transmembrane protein, putative n=1 Tax=Tetrahymena thermophila (strain SB210) TaxID=312017 RepID=W7X3E9_TETTS|nr:transmembrane protein, putative [Tetrahymena thermophila SB210]EWS71982.1 transmembrane protein, putative [Tetrahymena thermophila SB210]|eukprot:XP_012655482.1 transmembrane protein, putative [Tetrahymena thermophila SB210]
MQIYHMEKSQKKCKQLKNLNKLMLIIINFYVMLTQINIYKVLQIQNFSGIPKVYYVNIQENKISWSLIGLNALQKIYQIFGIQNLYSKYHQSVIHSQQKIYIQQCPSIQFLNCYILNIHKVYLINFGFTKIYLLKDEQHRDYTEVKSQTITARYASKSAYLGRIGKKTQFIKLGIYAYTFYDRFSTFRNLKTTHKNDNYKKIKKKILKYMQIN